MGEANVEKLTKLSEMQAEKDVDGLIKVLKDRDKLVRARAAIALEIIGDPRAGEPLIQGLKDKNELVRARAASALGQIGDTQAVEPLTEALGDQDALVQGAAKRALEMLSRQRGQRQPPQAPLGPA